MCEKNVSRQERIFLYTTITICMVKVILKIILLFSLHRCMTNIFGYILFKTTTSRMYASVHQ